MQSNTLDNDKPQYPLRTKRLIPIEQAAETCNIPVGKLLDMGAEGKLSMCISAPPNKVSLWVIDELLLEFNNFETGHVVRRSMKFNKGSKGSYIEREDQSNTKWLTISPEDCKEILLSGSSAISLFSSGWRLNSCSEFEKTDPVLNDEETRLKKTHNNIQNNLRKNETGRTIYECRFITHETNYIKPLKPDYSEPFRQKPIEVTIKELLIPDSDLNLCFQEENHDECLIHLELSGLLTGCKSSKLRHLIMTASYFWHVTKKTENGRYPSTAEIANFLRGKHPESFKSIAHLKPTPAEHAARMIRPTDLTKEALSNVSDDAFLSPKLKTLIKAYNGEWKETIGDERSTITDRIVSYLVDNGYTQDEAEAGAAIIRHDKAQKANTNRPKTKQPSKR